MQWNAIHGTCGGLAAAASTSMCSRGGGRGLPRHMAEHGHIMADNGLALTLIAFVSWCSETGAEVPYARAFGVMGQFRELGWS